MVRVGWGWGRGASERTSWGLGLAGGQRPAERDISSVGAREILGIWEGCRFQRTGGT